jgi:hypothetical protein
MAPKDWHRTVISHLYRQRILLALYQRMLSATNKQHLKPTGLDLPTISQWPVNDLLSGG